MILEFTNTNFVLDGGYYYSPEYKQDTIDTLMTVAVQLGVVGTFSMQESIDGINWLDVPDSTVICSLTGLQTFIDCHFELRYRIKTDQIVTKAQIAI